MYYWIVESDKHIAGIDEEEESEFELAGERLRATYIAHCESGRKRDEQGKVKF